MKPAFSVVFLTTLIGAGQGLFLALYAAEVLGSLGATAPPGPRFLNAGSSFAALLAALGLVASFFHFGRLFFALHERSHPGPGHKLGIFTAEPGDNLTLVANEHHPLPFQVAAIGQHFIRYGRFHAAVIPDQVKWRQRFLSREFETNRA